MWENALRSSIERLHGQKPNLTTPETPLQSRPGMSLILSCLILL
jgi:membrane-associated protease RseP (regulator of RpoE activity)